MYFNPSIRLLVLFALLLLTKPLLATELTGKIVGVHDGDTLTLLVSDGARFKQVKVRLAEIDTPESKQPYGQRAKQALSDLTFGKQVRVVVPGYGQVRPHGRAGVRGWRGRERGTGQTWGCVGIPAVFPRPQLARPRTARQGGKTRPVDTAGSATLPALGLAARDLWHRARPGDHHAGHHRQRRLLV